jgi:glycerol-3-phosphate dehydrogenase
MDIENTEFDVIVIGAGINGAGIARDASMRGLKVLLLDKGDIGGGTSSWSTRLIHGGLRYLEHGEFNLVRESLRERESLLKIAPHLVHPLALLLPIYRQARRGLWTICAGMLVYDAMSFRKSLPSHRMLSLAQTLQKAPKLNREGLRGAAIYFDAQVEFAERLVLENVLSAVEHGATVITYALVNKLIAKNGKACGVEFTEVESPTSNVERPTSEARARIVINAAGPWVDQIFGKNKSPRLIGGTKGSHIIVAPFAGAPQTAIYVEAETDRRPFFIIPWNQKYLIGTTDIPFEGDPDEARIGSGEIDYLLHETNRVLPSANLTREQILFAYSGVRPLPFTTKREGQSVTRRHFIRAHPELDNLFSIVGGKLTTYRSLSEQAVDAVFKKLGREAPGCKTDREPLPGAGAPDLEHFNQLSPFSAVTNNRLLRVYGVRSSLICKLVEREPSLAKVFDEETGAVAAEVVFAFKHEFAKTLSDCLLRRTMVGLNSTCGLTAVEAAATIAQQYLGWSEARVKQEIAGYRNVILTGFRVASW